jgi:hypothetical protein
MIATPEHVSPKRLPQRQPEDRREYLQKTISASRLGLWLQCRLKFYFRYIAQIQKPPHHQGTLVPLSMPSCKTGICRAGDGKLSRSSDSKRYSTPNGRDCRKASKSDGMARN